MSSNLLVHSVGEQSMNYSYETLQVSLCGGHT